MIELPIEKARVSKPKFKPVSNSEKSLINQMSEHFQTLAITKSYETEIVDIMNS